MRSIIGILGFLATGLYYSHRSSLSVAIVRMAKYNSSAIHVQENDHGTCLVKQSNNNGSFQSNVIIRGEFDWSESMQGLILGANYYSYLITPTISGRLTERFGAKWLTLISVTIAGIILALIPTAAYYSVNLLISILVVQGLFHGCIFTSLFSLSANWFTGIERTYAIAGLAAGSNFGNLVAYNLAGYLCENGFAGGWPSVFYVISLAHIPWIVLWVLCVEDTPVRSNSSGFIKCSDRELKYIQKNINSFGAPKSTSTAPWKSIFISRCFWASVIAKIAGGWGFYLLMSKMPSYLDKVFGLSLLKNGLFTSMTSLSNVITNLLGGPISALVIRNTANRISKTRIRKTFETIALIGPAVCLAIITTMNCDSTAVIVLLIIGLFLYGFITGGEFPIISEFAPDFTGTIFGIATTLSIFPAFVAPYVVGLILGDNPGDKNRWNIVWYITIAIYIFGAVVFELCASAEPQYWGRISKSPECSIREKTDETQ